MQWFPQEYIQPGWVDGRGLGMVNKTIMHSLRLIHTTTWRHSLKDTTYNGVRYLDSGIAERDELLNGVVRE